jgi:hypothetical protein
VVPYSCVAVRLKLLRCLGNVGFCHAWLGWASNYMNCFSMACAGLLVCSQYAADFALPVEAALIEWMSACESAWLGLAAGYLFWSLLTRMGSRSPLQGCCSSC